MSQNIRKAKMGMYKPFRNSSSQQEIIPDVTIHMGQDGLPSSRSIKTMLTPKSSLVLGCLQLFCATYTAFMGNIWWFSSIIAITGGLVMLAGFYQYRRNYALITVGS